MARHITCDLSKREIVKQSEVVSLSMVKDGKPFGPPLEIDGISAIIIKHFIRTNTNWTTTDGMSAAK